MIRLRNPIESIPAEIAKRQQKWRIFETPSSFKNLKNISTLYAFIILDPHLSSLYVYNALLDLYDHVLFSNSFFVDLKYVWYALNC